VVVNAAPGSLALRLTSYTGTATQCLFNQGDTVVVVFTRQTTFDPADVTANKTFPNNLKGAQLSVSGPVLGLDKCILEASAVNVTVPPSPSPTAKKSTKSPTPTKKATPTPSPIPTTASPAASPSPSPASSPSPSPSP
jgi:hypothetical protein